VGGQGSNEMVDRRAGSDAERCAIAQVIESG
jgi:hypothetical protein